MEYLTLAEAANRLGMPARVLEKLPIHRCAEGYACEVIDDFARQHRIPQSKKPFIIGVNTPVEEWLSVETWPEALWCANEKTVAVVGQPPVQNVALVLKTYQVRPLIVAIGESRHADWCAESWQDARQHLQNINHNHA